MQNDTTLGERVSEAREALGLSLEEAAQRLAVKKATLKSWEAGRTQPRPNKLQMLAGVLGVPFSWLLNGSDEHDPMSDDSSRLDQLELKLTRVRQLQAELGLLCDEIAHELAEIRKVDEHLEELVA
ncbi:MAG: helix-turn-helix domain-containing protein [Rhizobiales bacterium]|nr:helix-turn-helix domain-containing protein [Hyphomicrobiales bacterium]